MKAMNQMILHCALRNVTMDASGSLTMKKTTQVKKKVLSENAAMKYWKWQTQNQTIQMTMYQMI